MILHVTFSDGSNPWVSLPADRHTIAKHWRRWMKYHPDTAQPLAYSRPGCYVYPEIGGGYTVQYLNPQTGYELRHYKHLGHALAALDRLGGDR